MADPPLAARCWAGHLPLEREFADYRYTKNRLADAVVRVQALRGRLLRPDLPGQNGKV